jgi:2-polyprenyl-6-methoxyphenol hydroxylase-like FAD-dependent oxidoreductase
MSFFDRRVLLEILYNRLGDYQGQVHTSKKVVKVEHLPTKVLVHCDDQLVIEGDIVVGADGVRSTVRQQMWHHMQSIGMGKEVKEEKASMLDPEGCSCAY